MSKMQLLKCLKAFVGYGRCTYMEIVLKEIELAKEMFILDLTNKYEADIPIQLLQDHLPLSFHFYDPVILIAQEHTSEKILTQ